MRLIDADELNSFIDKWLSKKCDANGNTAPNKWLNNLKRCVEKQSTAYSVDGVVAELEKIRAKKTCNKEKCDTKEICRICVVDDAIEIVKQGCVSDDFCEWKHTSTAKYKTSCGYGLEEYFDTKACYYKQCGKKIKVVN